MVDSTMDRLSNSRIVSLSLCCRRISSWLYDSVWRAVPNGWTRRLCDSPIRLTSHAKLVYDTCMSLTPPAFVTTRVHLEDVVDRVHLRDALAAGLVNVRTSDDGQHIYNYSKTAPITPGAFDNPAVRACRGIITDENGYLIARAWAKFFNHNQTESGVLDLTAPVEVTDKLDGSMGVVHVAVDGSLRVATRGSFDSTMARHATRWLQASGMTLTNLNHVTPIVEIIYPENRIVVSYGARDELVLLGGVNIVTGDYYGPTETAALVGWTGTLTEVFTYQTLADALTAAPRDGMEGLCVRFLDRSHIVKIKQADYLQMHRLVTGLNERRLWESLAVEACVTHIETPHHWGTYLHMDPARAAECLAAGPDWRQTLFMNLPDEFLDWTRKQLDTLTTAAEAKKAEILDAVATVRDLPRKDAYERLKNQEYVAVAMALLSGSARGEGTLVKYAWDVTCPESARSLFARDEDED